MKIVEIKLNQIIDDLNKKKTISKIDSTNLKNFDLTENEKKIITTYQPEKSLIIYGTLSPGSPNHSVIEHIKGKWQKAIVKGKLENKGWGAEFGYFGFRPIGIDEQIEIDAYILFSEELVENWDLLDDFEGVEYKRILAKYELENGEIGVGYIYAINDDN